MKRHRNFGLLAIFVLSLDILLLRYFNTLIWPYLWPKPAFFILLGGFVIALWFPELFKGIWTLRVVGLWMVFIGQCYVIHSFLVFVDDWSLIALIHWLGITGTFLVMVLNYLNQIRPKINSKTPSRPDILPPVAVIVPTYGEPIHILERTIVSLKELEYPEECLYIVISDDGRRDEVYQLAASHHVHYNPGPRKDAKAGNLNAALAYVDTNFPQAKLILTQDADEMIAPSFLMKTVGYFDDPGLAFVQTPKEVFTPSGDPFGNRDRVFYDILQPGRNGSDAAFSCGSGVLWNLDAVKSIGGFSTWNLVEDLTTSFLLHSAGYHSEYHNEVLSIGLSPDDIPSLLKQRGTWAADTWRLFLFKNPLTYPGLSFRQRLQYLELSMFYFSSAFFMPLLMFTPLLSLATSHFIPIEGAALYPWMAISILYYIALAQGNISFLLRMWQYWLGHWPTYTRAFWVAIRSRFKKPAYTVTRKTHQRGFYGFMLWPQFLFVFAGAIVIVRSFVLTSDSELFALFPNTGLLLLVCFLLVSGICRASFHGVSAREIFYSLTEQTNKRLKRAITSIFAVLIVTFFRNR